MCILPQHRPPFVYQWRARVHVYVRTLTRDHASPPRTRGGIASLKRATIAEKSPARRTSGRPVSSASSRSSRDRVERSPPNRFAGKVDPLRGGRESSISVERRRRIDGGLSTSIGQNQECVKENASIPGGYLEGTKLDGRPNQGRRRNRDSWKEKRASREKRVRVTKMRREGICFAKETQAATRYLHPSEFAPDGILDGEMKNVGRSDEHPRKLIKITAAPSVSPLLAEVKERRRRRRRRFSLRAVPADNKADEIAPDSLSRCHNETTRRRDCNLEFHHLAIARGEDKTFWTIFGQRITNCKLPVASVAFFHLVAIFSGDDLFANFSLARGISIISPFSFVNGPRGSRVQIKRDRKGERKRDRRREGGRSREEREKDLVEAAQVRENRTVATCGRDRVMVVVRSSS
ncbi:hypothetical protein DBV15_09769 [Temnothorax longispinosus]|uniref:Uncharacterized protein n=1 Tax=Temnothorax longispinosus TaxID=300112 RepID=A0A4S2KJC3_9HYME|nr:hypothetical protein DBV15_09769 [Temnothorax longispinosus]